MATAARFIYMVLIVDMMVDPATGKQEKTDADVEKQADVVAQTTLCASSPAEAADKAFKLLAAENLLVQNRRYHVHCLMLAPLPHAGGQILLPSAGESKAILKAGEISPPPGKPTIATR